MNNMNNMNQTQLEFAKELSKCAKVDLERISFDKPFVQENRTYGIICLDKNPAVIFGIPQEGKIETEQLENFYYEIKMGLVDFLIDGKVYVVSYR